MRILRINGRPSALRDDEKEPPIHNRWLLKASRNIFLHLRFMGVFRTMRHFICLALFFAFITACSSPRPAAPHRSAPVVLSEPMVAPSPIPSPLPGLYHRIDQGYSLGKTKSKAFTKTMNAKFFPLFPKAHPLGLAAYRPALPKNPKGCALPAEIALLSFKSERDYEKYKNSKIGKQIAQAHRLAFNPDTSRSVVPESLNDTLHFGHAYSLNPGAHDYRKSFSALIVHCDPLLKGDDLRIALVKAYAGGTSAEDVLFEVENDHLVEFVFFSKEEDAAALITERQERFRTVFRNDTVVALPKRKIGKKPNFSVGDGIDAQW